MGFYQQFTAEVQRVEFVGYETLTSPARVLAMVDLRSGGARRVREAGEGDEVEVILDRTPAYPESGGQIGFAISAVMSEALQKAVKQVGEKEWKTITTEADGTLRQWAEVEFVPGEASEKKGSQPLRYVGLRLLKAQGVLFADGSDRHHHAVVTNLDWAGDRLLQWQREKAGTVEHVHDEVKNALGGGHMPCQHFHVNAAWFKLSLLAYNVSSAMRRLALSPEERTVRMKKLRLLVINLAGRMSRFQCTLRLRFCATQKAIERVLKIWEVFELPTQATAFR